VKGDARGKMFIPRKRKKGNRPSSLFSLDYGVFRREGFSREVGEWDLSTGKL